MKKQILILILMGVLAYIGFKPTQKTVSTQKQALTPLAAPQEQGAALPATAFPTLEQKTQSVTSLSDDDQIMAIDREIEDHERFLYKENAIRRLNENTASEEQRNLYFDVIEKLTAARARKIELRIKMLQAKIDAAGIQQ